MRESRSNWSHWIRRPTARTMDPARDGTASSPSAAVRPLPRTSRSSTSPRTASMSRGYTNPRICELWAAARSTPDAAKQDESYHELAKILNEDVPQVNLYSPNLVMVSTKRLDGGFKVHLNERETFMNVETWTLQ